MQTATNRNYKGDPDLLISLMMQLDLAANDLAIMEQDLLEQRRFVERLRNAIRVLE